jgi:hypothetical protein
MSKKIRLTDGKLHPSCKNESYGTSCYDVPFMDSKMGFEEFEKEMEKLHNKYDKKG